MPENVILASVWRHFDVILPFFLLFYITFWNNDKIWRKPFPGLIDHSLESYWIVRYGAIKFKPLRLSVFSWAQFKDDLPKNKFSGFWRHNDVIMSAILPTIVGQWYQNMNVNDIADIVDNTEIIINLQFIQNQRNGYSFAHRGKLNNLHMYYL